MHIISSESNERRSPHGWSNSIPLEQLLNRRIFPLLHLPSVSSEQLTCECIQIPTDAPARHKIRMTDRMIGFLRFGKASSPNAENLAPFRARFSSLCRFSRYPYSAGFKGPSARRIRCDQTAKRCTLRSRKLRSLLSEVFVFMLVQLQPILRRIQGPFCPQNPVRSNREALCTAQQKTSLPFERGFRL